MGTVCFILSAIAVVAGVTLVVTRGRWVPVFQDGVIIATTMKQHSHYSIMASVHGEPHQGVVIDKSTGTWTIKIDHTFPALPAFMVTIRELLVLRDGADARNQRELNDEVARIAAKLLNQHFAGN